MYFCILMKSIFKKIYGEVKIYYDEIKVEASEFNIIPMRSMLRLLNLNRSPTKLFKLFYVCN